MSLNNISDNVEGLNKSAQEFLETNYDYYRLSAFKKLTKGTTSMITFIIIGAILFGAMLLLTFSIALFLGAWLDNLGLGFLILGASYILIAVIVYYGFRKTIERKVLMKASSDFFDED
ncbi:phage holin family protein [Joostella atrarenae]|uniref:Phage holin family protein n=1 Tax=Joostella atrarenae TaxID=679257 RepID=A0ABS9IZQ3_9FLAO|nr:phage holin family protein [Joostella atrarenae]MCF8713624.1 phage holin family protein [Joostella atrarenae]